MASQVFSRNRWIFVRAFLLSGIHSTFAPKGLPSILGCSFRTVSLNFASSGILPSNGPPLILSKKLRLQHQPFMASRQYRYSTPLCIRTAEVPYSLSHFDVTRSAAINSPNDLGVGCESPFFSASMSKGLRTIFVQFPHLLSRFISFAWMRRGLWLREPADLTILMFGHARATVIFVQRLGVQAEGEQDLSLPASLYEGFSTIPLGSRQLASCCIFQLSWLLHRRRSHGDDLPGSAC